MLSLLERLYRFFCRHQWVRERDADGSLAECCIKCMAKRRDRMAELTRWQPLYRPLDAVHQEFPAQLPHDKDSAA